MHVLGEAAAKDLDYSQGLNFMLPSFLPLLPWKRKLSAMLPALLQRCTSQLNICRVNGLGEKSRWQGALAAAEIQLGTWLVEPICWRAQTVVQCQFAHGVLAT